MPSNSSEFRSIPTIGALAAPTLRVKDEFVTMTFELPVSLARSKKGGALDETPEKSSEKILHLLRSNPALSAKALAEELGISSRAVEKQIDLLKKVGSLIRVGPAKGGHWQVRQ